MGRKRPTSVALAAVIATAVIAVPALGVVIQQGPLRIMIAAQMKPYKLPRTGSAPIDVFLAGHVSSTDGTTPPQLQRMEIKLNRHGVIDTKGLPRCHLPQIAPSTFDQAISRCGPALIGSGRFWASVVLPDTPSYKTTGRLLVFNGVQRGRPVLLAHIYTPVPFPSSFVVTFAIRKIDEGPYGTELSTSLPQSLGDWGFVDRIKMTLGRTYDSRGRQYSYLNAACPAPKGLGAVVFPLARATFHFAEGLELNAKVTRPCGVRR